MRNRISAHSFAIGGIAGQGYSGMGGGVVAYIETEPEIEIRAGMVYITSSECGGSGRFVMSVHTFKKVIRRANRELAQWDAGERNVIDFPLHAASP